MAQPRFRQRRKIRPVHETGRSPWYVSLLVTAILALFAYLVAIFLYILSYKVAAAPGGPLVDDSMRASFQFVFLVLVISGLTVFIVRSSVDVQTRIFSFFTVAFLLGISLAKLLHLIQLDPNAPADTLIRTILGPLAPYYDQLLRRVHLILTH